MKRLIHNLIWTIAVINASNDNGNAIYGVCYQLSTTIESDFILLPQIIPMTNNKFLSFSDYFDINWNNTDNTQFIDCIWFSKNRIAHSASALTAQALNDNFQDNTNVQIVNQKPHNKVHCKHVTFRVNDTNLVQSQHLCSNNCETDNPAIDCDDLIAAHILPRSVSHANEGSPLRSTFEVTGIGAGLIMICIAGYCVSLKYSKWNREKHAKHKSEQVINDVLNDIAKYTMGATSDDQMWNDDWSESDNSSQDVEEQEICSHIMRVISNASSSHLCRVDDHPNPEIFDSDSSDESADLHLAQQTLYATSFGTDSLHNLDIEIANDNKAGSINLTMINEVSDAAISSDVGHHSDLP